MLKDWAYKAARNVDKGQHMHRDDYPVEAVAAALRRAELKGFKRGVASNAKLNKILKNATVVHYYNNEEDLK